MYISTITPMKNNNSFKLVRPDVRNSSDNKTDYNCLIERQVYIYLHVALVLVHTLYRIDKNSRLEIKAKERRPLFGRLCTGPRNAWHFPVADEFLLQGTKTSTTMTTTTARRLGFETARKPRSNVHRREKRSWIVFCFVQRVGGHHDDRIEHKRGAPEGVTGHKIPRRPLPRWRRDVGASPFSHIKPVPPLP